VRCAGRLPLAIELAAAYIEANGISIADYRERYRGAPGALLDDKVAATWAMSIEQLRTEDPTALDLLNRIAFLARDDIDSHLLADRFADALQLDRARAGLLRYSLIEVRGGTLSVHRLVQAANAFAREGLEQERAEAAVKRVGNALQIRSAQGGDLGCIGSPAAPSLGCRRSQREPGCGAGNHTPVAKRCWLYLENRAQLMEAERCLRRALAIGEEAYGPDHPTLRSASADASEGGLLIPAKNSSPTPRDISRPAGLEGCLLPSP